MQKKTREAIRKQIAIYGSEDAVVLAAMEILRNRMSYRTSVSNPTAVRHYLSFTLENLDHEVFWMVCLDAQHRVIAADELFRGTLTQTSVYPREVVKYALRYNAAAAIFAHNHPSGVPEPSQADEIITRTLKAALALVDVAVLDHFIISEGAISTSFAERGLL